MKKILLVILMMLLAAWCSATVYLVKSKFSNNYWQAFIPADDTGEYWLQIGFGTPINDDLCLPNVSILDMTYGKLCDAKQVCLLTAANKMNTADETIGGGFDTIAWDALIATQNGDYCGAGENGDGSTKFVTYDPPDTHNEIHVFYYYTTAAQTNVGFSWTDGTTTDLLETNLGSTFATNGIRELIVLKGTAVGSRVLKCLPPAGQYARILGFRSWNTNAKGDLSTDGDDCLVTRFKQINTSGDLCSLDPSVCSNLNNTFALGDNLVIGEAYEPAFAWDSGDVDYAFTGGNTHYIVTSTNNVYGMANAYSIGLPGPEIWVDGANSGALYQDSGTATADDATGDVLTDSGAAWTVDALIGMTVYNSTDGSSAVITDNDATTVTANLAGGTANTWTTTNAYIICWPRGTKLSGDRIVIHHKGTIAGATAGAAIDPPNCDWSYIIDNTGLTVMCVVTWQSTIAFSATPSIYTPQFPMNNALAANLKFRWPLTDTETSVPVGTAANVTYSNKGSICELLHNQFVMRLTSFSPVSIWLYANNASQNKLYGWVQDSIPGNKTPVSGDVMTLGGKYEVRRIRANKSEYWQDIFEKTIYGTGGGPFN